MQLSSAEVWNLFVCACVLNMAIAVRFLDCLKLPDVIG